MGRFLLVCIGGALGSGARYLVAVWAASALPIAYPMGTTIVNVAGSFLLALVTDLSLRFDVVSPDLRLFLTTGICGGFTTYSTFNWEAYRLVEDRAFALAATYVLGTLVACGVAAILGVLASRGFMGVAGAFLGRG